MADPKHPYRMGKSNFTKLSLGSFSLLFLFACGPSQKEENTILSKKDTCIYSANETEVNFRRLSCVFCHVSSYHEINDSHGGITTFGLSKMDSLKLVDYVFTKKHKGWYTKNGAFKSNRLDSLSNCDIKNIIHYIKDYGRPQAPVPDGKK